MNKRFALIALIALTVSIIATSCGGSKNLSDRGTKLDKEECQQMAMEKVKGWRDYGNGTSAKESLAQNIAELNARARLTNQLQTQINTFIRSFNQQHEATGASDLVGKVSEIQEGYTEKLLTGVKVICSNTYVKKDGTYNVFVCVEMSEDAISAVYKKLSEDKKLAIDFSEHQFKKEMEKAKEDYRNSR